MKLGRLWGIVFLLFLSAISGLSAENEDAGGWALDVKAGTLGIGADLNRSIVPGLLNLRAGVSLYSHTADFDIDGIRYNTDLRLGAVPVSLDVFPFRNWFRLGGGFLFNLNEFTGRTPLSGTISIGDNQYEIQDFGRLEAKIDFNEVAPFVGIGFNNPIKKSGRLGFFADLGFMYHGTPAVTLSTSQPVSNPQFQADLEKELQNINEDIRDYTILPIIQLGISYRF